MDLILDYKIVTVTNIPKKYFIMSYLNLNLKFTLIVKQGVNARRKEIQDMLVKQRKQRNDQTTDEFRIRNLMVNHEMKKQDLQDSIQHLQV